MSIDQASISGQPILDATPDFSSGCLSLEDILHKITIVQNRDDLIQERT